MPEICRLSDRTTRICMYADDHAPPHFHVEGRGWTASIDLQSLMTMRSRGQLQRARIREAIQWAQDNMEILEAEWRRLNERDDE